MTTEVFARENFAHKFPVSIKGVVLRGNRVALLKNLRNEWELPGGKIEIGETPEDCVRREIQEELGLHIRIVRILDTWIYHIAQDIDVFIVTYGCLSSPDEDVVLSPEHRAVALFEIDEVPSLNMPQGYKDSILNWARWVEANPMTPQ